MIVSVTDPKRTSLKVDPRTCVEVITKSNSSQSTVLEGHDGILMECCGYQFDGIQQRFLFQYPEEIGGWLERLPAGNYDGGKLLFGGGYDLNLTLVIGQEVSNPELYSRRVTLRKLNGDMESGCRLYWY